MLLKSIAVIPVLMISSALAQPITGVWKGKIKSTRIELKLVKKGDSLVGTSYYYDSKDSYRRFSVKGYFDEQSNSVIWWDDALIEDRFPSGGFGKGVVGPLMVVADFNCPGEGEMKLDGDCAKGDIRGAARDPLHLQKVKGPVFSDQWDYVLQNYSRGANDPDLIDSVARLALHPAEMELSVDPSAAGVPISQAPVETAPSRATSSLVSVDLHVSPKLTPEEKFASRTKTLETVIPVTGDSIELRFYDDAEIDGDSIAVFLNGRMLKQDIGLTDQPYKIFLSARELEEDNELVMVAENLGSIPPNTSLMVVLIGNKRYEARLFADEQSSAMVRFVKESPSKQGSAPPNP